MLKVMPLHNKNQILIVIITNFPHTTLKASGLDVGLPDGQMGNSEVGHTNIGAGRIVYQSLTRIDKSNRRRRIRIKPSIKRCI